MREAGGVLIFRSGRGGIHFCESASIGGAELIQILGHFLLLRKEIHQLPIKIEIIELFLLLQSAK